jgi:hypothetical protein
VSYRLSDEQPQARKRAKDALLPLPLPLPLPLLRLLG